MKTIDEKINALVEAIIFKKVKPTDPLYTSRLIDSMGIIDLAMSIEEEFSIKIHTNDIIEKNFDTVERIIAYVSQRIK